MLLPLLSTAVIAAVVWRTYAAWRLERATAARLVVGPSGIIPGAEPIELADEGRERAVLLLHGFGDTPQTLRYLAEELHAHGWAVHVPLLPGHGRTLRAFAASRGEDWVAAARAALHALRARYGDDGVSVVGLSMGGALASILAAEEGPLPALVLIAPYLDAPPHVRRLARWHRALGVGTAYFAGQRAGARSIHDERERAKTLGYRASSPRLLFDLVAVADRGRAALGRITAPTLLIQSREDNRVAPAVAEQAYAALGAREKRLEWVTGSGHVITVDFGRERVLALAREWLAAHGGDPALGRDSAGRGLRDVDAGRAT